MKDKNASQNPGGPRSAARLAAVQAFYQLSMAEEPDAGKVAAEYINHRLGAEIEGDQYVEADVELFKDILAGAWGRREEWRGMIASHLNTGWTIERIDRILIAILSAGCYEFSARIDVPTAVIINEYVDVTHGFYDKSEASFVNGVLDRLSKDLRP